MGISRKAMKVGVVATTTAAALVFAASAAFSAGAQDDRPAGSRAQGRGSSAPQASGAMSGQSRGASGNVNMPSADVATGSAGTASISEDLSAQLQYLVEEEKLAGDVYSALYDQWGSQVFANIAASEDRHQTQVAALLSTYGIDDPSSQNAGEFANPDLQALYTQLVDQGSQSLSDAYEVGKAIEELDISDLDAMISSSPADPLDVQQVVQKLRTGSEHHLAAFERQLG